MRRRYGDILVCGTLYDVDAIAQKHNIKVVEDACQAGGGSYKGKRLGSIGEAGGFSFNYFKIITACVGIDPDWTEEQIQERAQACRKAAAAL